MKIIDLYELKINRNINPAVVVSNNDKETVANEIGEYVFTDEILEKNLTSHPIEKLLQSSTMPLRK